MDALERNQINIEDEMRRSYLDYAMSVIIGRALGERLTEKEIPKAFARVIEAAVKVSDGEE